MNDADAKSQYAEAKRLFREGQARDALKLLRALDAAVPGAKHVQLAQAECLVALGDHSAARGICDSILAREDDARARRILARCAEEPPPLPAQAQAFAGFDLPEDQQRQSPKRILIAAAGVVVATIAIVLLAEHDWSRPDPHRIQAPRAEPVPELQAKLKEAAEPVDPVAEYAKLLEEKKAKRDAAKRDTEAKATAELEAVRSKPGYIVPPEEWNLDPNTGVPEWRPGIYRQLPCAGSWFEETQSPRTIDVYIPIAYAEKPEEQFPVLTISMPGKNLGFRGYESWAEHRGVILVVLNSSYNEGGIASNTQAQLAAYNFLNGHIRAHPLLNFATGSSGGAQMSWIMAANSPDMFSGILMCSQGGYRDRALAPHIRVAYVNGNEDWNADYIVEMIALLKANGNEVRHQVVPGGHIEGPLDVRTRMLDWLLESGKKDLEEPAAEEPSEQ